VVSLQPLANHYASFRHHPTLALGAKRRVRMNCITVLSSSLSISAYLARNLELERIVAISSVVFNANPRDTGQRFPLLLGSLHH